MPAEIFLMKVGMTMTDGTIASWYVEDGGEVTEGDLLYLLETEKVAMDVEAPASGTVRHLVRAGTKLPAATVIGYIYGAGETVPASMLTPGSTSPAIAEAQTPTAEEIAAPPSSATDAAAGDPVQPPGGQRPASPLARRVAKELGLDIGAVVGTGPGGRITEFDVRAAAAVETRPTGAPAAPAEAPQPPRPSSVSATRPLTGIRKHIADHMRASLQTTAQLTMNMEVAMGDVVRLRKQLRDEWEPEGIRPTFTDIVVKAVGRALRTHPYMNAALRDGELAFLPDVHLGLAIALDEGLIVATITDADVRSIKEIAVESKRLADAARNRRLTLDETKGATFTVTNLGRYGVESFTPILNLPQVGILGVNAIRDTVAWENERPVRRQVMNLSLTWDHQAVDGVPAAVFLASVRDLLEAPYQHLI